MTTVVACSHGTRSAAGRAVVEEVRARLADALPDVRVVEAYVDVEQPEVDVVVARAAAEDDVVVLVPLLLSTGFHTKVDIARAAAPHPNVVVAEPIGPHALLIEALLGRLADLPGGDSGRRPGDHVVLAAAGSTDPAAARAIERMRELLEDELPVRVSAAYGAGAIPRIPDAVAAARAAGARRVIAASYVLAPGHFAQLIHAAGADQVTDVLGAHPAVVDTVVGRIAAALARAADEAGAMAPTASV